MAQRELVNRAIALLLQNGKELSNKKVRKVIKELENDSNN